MVSNSPSEPSNLVSKSTNQLNSTEKDKTTNAIPRKGASPSDVASGHISQTRNPKTDTTDDLCEQLRNDEETHSNHNGYSFEDEQSYDICGGNNQISEYDEDEHYDDSADNYGGGIRERSLLCPILEEDGESTASTSSLAASSLTNSMTRPKYVASVSKYDEPSSQQNDNENERNKVIPQENCELLNTENASVAAGEVQDGHYFIRMLENEIFKFEELICDFEDLGEIDSLSNTSCTDGSTISTSIPEDVRDSILAAVGKAKLLMSQKMVQFRGLCDKNIAAMDPNAEPDPYVPTPDDLAGFWDMVYIQVEHIHFLFAELRELRSNGWKRPEPVSKKTAEPSSISPSKRGVSVTKKKKPIRPSSARVPGKKPESTNGNDDPNASNESGTNKEEASNKKSEAAKARDEARKKMMAERKKKMLELKQKAKDGGADNKQNDDTFVVI